MWKASSRASSLRVGSWWVQKSVRTPAARITRALRGRRVLAVHRHGKHLWFELDGRPWLTCHFGMTGGFHTPGAGTVKLISSGKKKNTGSKGSGSMTNDLMRPDDL